MATDTILTGLRLPQVRLVASYWVRFSLRTGGGLICLLLVLLTGLGVGAAFITPIENVMKASPEVGHSGQEAAVWMKEVAESEEFVDLVKDVIGAGTDQARYWLQGNPALFSVIFLVLFWFFPFLACIGAFNQTAGDIGSRGLRYLLLRTERPNVFLGRFAGTVVFSAIASAVLVLLLLLYIGIKFRVYPWGDMIVWTLQGYVAIFLLVLPYIAMCAWLSSLFESAFGSLSVCLLATGFPIFFLKSADAMAAVDLSWMMRLLPWGWKYELLDVDIGTRLVACTVMIGFTLLFLALGLRSFGKRDL